MKIKDIIIYPIKSLGGVSLKEGICEPEGLKYDRRMMLVDDQGIFITQRAFPELALIGAEMLADGFRFYKKNNEEESIFIPHDCELGDVKTIKVWRHSFKANAISEYNEWFSKQISMKVTLVKMSDVSLRHKALIKAPSRTRMSMADGYPYLILSDATLEDLNRRLIVPVPMNRFRPNLVLTNVGAYEEESLDKIKIGEVNFRMIKPCARCNMVTIDQKTAKKLVEPLKTLSLYKKSGNKIYFGMNAVSLGEGKIQLGDLVSKN